MTDISLIICTRNRCEALRKSLNALDHSISTLEGAITLEVILVDNGSSDDTFDVMTAFSPPCRVVRLKETRPGLAAARNAGLDCATGEIIAFTDDDCEVSTHYFSELLENARQMKTSFVIGGRVDLGDPADLPITIKPSAVEEELMPNCSPAGFIHGCNMAFSRDVLAKVGKFDTRFGAGAVLKSGEDTDFILRAKLAGIRVKYFPNMQVRHYHGRRRPDEAKALARQYELGNGALLIKHGLSYPFLIKGFWFNMKDVALEKFGKRKSIGSDTVPERFDIFKCHLQGALRYALNRN